MKNNNDIAKFIEEKLGIKLLPYQKLLLKMRPMPMLYNGRRSSKKLDNYILLLKAADRMKDNDLVNIIFGGEVKVLDKEELIYYLQNEYWR